MITIILIIVIVVIAILFFWWNLHMMLDYVCPRCYESGDNEIMLPVIPAWRWWCPSCNEIIQHSDIVPRDQPSDEQADF